MGVKSGRRVRDLTRRGGCEQWLLGEQGLTEVFGFIEERSGIHSRSKAYSRRLSPDQWRTEDEEEPDNGAPHEDGDAGAKDHVNH